MQIPNTSIQRHDPKRLGLSEQLDSPIGYEPGEDHADTNCQPGVLAEDSSHDEQRGPQDAAHDDADLTARHREWTKQIGFRPAEHSQRNELQHDTGSREEDVEHDHAVEVQTECRKPHSG